MEIIVFLSIVIAIVAVLTSIVLVRRPLSMSYSPFRTSTEYIIVLYLEQYKLEAAY
jgi:hypothetical protein